MTDRNERDALTPDDGETLRLLESRRDALSVHAAELIRRLALAAPAAIARAEAAERDAARYRWLRDVWGRQIAIIGTSDCTFGVSTPSWRGAWLDFDAAIDAVMAPAIAAQQAEGEEGG
ncbi:MAG TPA: hypothetical protein VFF71_11900 [Luteimonas sp.]|nr:hypothetical protein [Luteimonas sp.]